MWAGAQLCFQGIRNDEAGLEMNPVRDHYQAEQEYKPLFLTPVIWGAQSTLQLFSLDFVKGLYAIIPNFTSWEAVRETRGGHTQEDAASWQHGAGQDPKPGALQPPSIRNWVLWFAAAFAQAVPIGIARGKCVYPPSSLPS